MLHVPPGYRNVYQYQQAYLYNAGHHRNHSKFPQRRNLKNIRPCLSGDGHEWMVNAGMTGGDKE